MAQELTYTTARAELEQIIRQLQRPDTEIDQLCQLTRRAVELITFCKERLTQVDEELVKVLENIQ